MNGKIVFIIPINYYLTAINKENGKKNGNGNRGRFEARN